MIVILIPNFQLRTNSETHDLRIAETSLPATLEPPNGYIIIPAATVSLVPSSISTKAPVCRLRR